MKKPLVFISHITPEQELALSLRDLVQSTFMGMIEVFVSSDPDSIAMGGKWLDRITRGLKECVIEVVLASPVSIRRPWINFEAGAGWVRDIPVIPICHSGLNPDTLPPPLSSLQAALATDKDQMERVLAVLAKELDCKLPDSIQCSEFIERVKRYESESQRIEHAQGGSLLANSGGLAPYEIATLVAVAECEDSPDDIIWPHRIKERMNQAGYRNVASVLGLAGLKRKGLIDTQVHASGNWNSDEEASVVTINQFGWAWLESNAESIELTDGSNESYVPASADAPASEDIPF